MELFKKIILLCCFPILLPTEAVKSTEYQYGIMNAFSSPDITTSNSTLEICFTYPPDFFTVRTEMPKTYTVMDLTDVVVCSNETNANAADFSTNGDTVFLMNKTDNCNLTEYFNYIGNNGSGLVLISDKRFILSQNFSAEVFAILDVASGQKLLNYENKGEIRIQLLTAPDRLFNSSILVLWALAFCCVMVGSYTGPYTEIPSAPSEQQILEGSGSSSGNKQQVSLNIVVVITLVVFISTTLLLLYFYYKYLVYFFMAVFCIASARATYDIWMQVLSYFKVGSHMPQIKGVGLHQILLALFCVSVPIVWFVFRHKTPGWILQDYLGICFCIHLIQTLRMPNLKVCTVLLSLLFLYDIFFVFITPYFTKDGQSVMVEVATGGNSGEDLPLLLKIPQLETDILTKCSTAGKFSLLGFGDIIVPGFLVCFAHSFDVINGNTRRRPYFVTTLIGYGFGLATAFVALTLSQTGQPALLYVVPSTLIPIFLVALCKKQVRALWDNPE